MISTDSAVSYLYWITARPIVVVGCTWLYCNCLLVNRLWFIYLSRTDPVTLFDIWGFKNNSDNWTVECSDPCLKRFHLRWRQKAALWQSRALSAVRGCCKKDFITVISFWIRSFGFLCPLLVDCSLRGLNYNRGQTFPRCERRRSVLSSKQTQLNVFTTCFNVHQCMTTTRVDTNTRKARRVATI